MVGGLEKTGVLKLIADLIEGISGDDPRLMVAIILWLSAIASAFVDNIPFAATMIPVIKALAASSGVAIMPNIKPISDLRNYTSVVKEVNYGSRVYLTKNGHGQIAMINMQELDDLEKQLALYRFQIEMQKGEQSIATEGTISSKELRKELGI